MQVRFPEFEPINPNGVPPWMRGAEFGQRMIGSQADLMKNLLEQQQLKQEIPYAGLSKYAQAMSQLAYSQLMGPQLRAKLLGNPDIFKGMNDEQRQKNVDLLIQQSMFPNGNGQLGNISPPDMSKIPLPNIPGQQQATSQPNQQTYNQQFNQNPIQQQTVENNQNPRPYSAEKVGDFESTIAQRKEQGNIRAKGIEELDNQYQGALETEPVIRNIADTLKSPMFQNMRRFPMFQSMQLSALAKVGTPEEQNMIGRFLADTQKQVASIVSSFQGRAMAKEFDFGNLMKVNPNDTYNVALGKSEEALLYNTFTKDRSRLASDIMDKQKISKGKALEIADKQMNGEKIRKDIKDYLYNQKETYPAMIHMRNTKTGAEHYVPEKKRSLFEKNDYIKV